MAFHEVRFPDDISRGARGGPERRTQIVELASGEEERNASWANSRCRYDVAYGIRRADDLAAVGDAFGQVCSLVLRHRVRLGPDALGKERDDLGIERIGLGQPPGGAGEIPDLAWIDHHKRYPAPASAAATVRSNPPVASRTTSAGAASRSHGTRWSSPAPTRGTDRTAPEGRRWTSRRSFDTSTPTYADEAEACFMTRPCKSGLATRPKRLFGLRPEPMDGGPVLSRGPDHKLKLDR